MRRIINYAPRVGVRVILAALPFVAVLAIYLIASNARLAIEPNDKLMPAFATFWATLTRLATTIDKATNQYLFWWDTWLSLQRLFLGLGISALAGLVLGILVGFIPYLRATFEPFFAAFSLIPPLAVLPILFILFGLGEVSKIVLIVFGIAPFIIRDVMLRVASIPAEQIIKAQTLGANTWQMISGVVLPQVMPRLIDSVRLSLGAAWLFVIAAEAITAEGGLGYRIFLVRRYLAMDVILPYVAWITLLAFLMDWGLRRLAAAAYPWDRIKAA
ncbi:ABC transporter permease [Ancylobacter amanitiformis]|uniref:NitT/TauT family transport system permease protein n=1 Tax=Ancylobacter amanitiformis TaxID=217069 RepID=A0ABU0LRU4_9HYPH|nr:ABC transporter permease subunit [Ancylobacter amanitiformis]MDQ0511394.1 NitT/TauT family transport system permease protein [Ancylobacter amanitiformis]